MRTEFGVERSSCACKVCQLNCRFMPGYLIPADLERMIPPGVDPFVWAESNLLASPGAKVMQNFEIYRIPTLVPAVKEDGSCIHLFGGKRNGRCDIHQIAPFGCAFFSCTQDVPGLSNEGLKSIMQAGPESLYIRLWHHLDALGKKQQPPEVLRQRMREAGVG